MSLAVNLIFESEQRSASKLNFKTVLRIFAVALPLLFLAIALQQAARHYVLQTNLRIRESRWESSEPRQRNAARQQSRLNLNMQIEAELVAWQKSAPQWDGVLLTIMESTPANIQVTTLRMQAIAAPGQPTGGSPPLRRPSLLIEGRVSEPEAMSAIIKMKEAIEEHPLTEPAISSADIINFAAAPTQYGSQMRVFSIRIQFKDLPRDDH